MKGRGEGGASDSGSAVNCGGEKLSKTPVASSLLPERGAILGGEVEIGDGVLGEDELLSLLVIRGLSSVFALSLRRGVVRVPAELITFWPVASSIGSQVLSA